MTTFNYEAGDELGAVNLWWRNSAGALIDFSAGYTFEVKLGYRSSTAVLTVTTGITGAVGSGAKPDGVPNLVITWTAANLGSLTVPSGVNEIVYPMFVKATTGGNDRHYPGTLAVRLGRLPT